MCGIAGWFSPAPQPSDANERLRRMVHAIRHRGPDGQGFLVSDHVALGHARLSIIDLAGGEQPMTAADSGVSISFNGEIYNYRALRAELGKRGYAFKTESDTEVILAIYSLDGWQGFSKLRGMYAFAIWDAQTHSGCLVRDPIGIKPLFYTKSAAGELAFASEVKALLAGDFVATEMDLGNLHLLMNFRYLPGNRTLFAGVQQLEPGAVLCWQSDGSQIRHQIQPPVDASDQGDTLAVLRESVAAHLTADVEVGAYLSGGVDSAAIMALRPDDGMRTFTMDAGDDPNEARNAARTAELLGVANSCEAFGSDPAAELRQLIWHLEVPKINALQVNSLAKMVSQHVKVVLSGLGGDELFLGYRMHGIMAKTGSVGRMVPQFLRGATGNLLASLHTLVPGPKWLESERGALMLAAASDPARCYGLLRNVWDSPAMRRELYGPRLLDQPLPNAFEVLQDTWPDEPDSVMAAARFEWQNKMVNDLLWQEDRCSMAQGLEVRVPFVDGQVAAHLANKSRTDLMPGGKLKGYMREILGPVLPAEVLNRPKSGFQVHAPQFFTEHLGTMADDLLSEQRVRESGLFNPAFIKDIRSRGTGTGLRWHYFILYLMLMTHVWGDVFE